MVGLRITTSLAAVRSAQCFLLGHELGALVVTDHVGERDGRVLIDDDPVGAEVHGGDDGCVDDALDASFAGEAQKLARAIDVGAIHCRGIGNPEAIIGGDVNDGIATGNCIFYRFRTG